MRHFVTLVLLSSELPVTGAIKLLIGDDLGFISQKDTFVSCQGVDLDTGLITKQ